MLAPLRIAIIGLGGIGSTFAFQLARVGKHHVTVIARPDSERLRQLRHDNGIVNSRGDRSGVSISDTLDEEFPYDLILVTLLAHQVDAIMPALQRSAATCIQFMFNTFHPERLQDALGVERCAFGMAFVQAMVDKDGKVMSRIGVAGQKSKLSQQQWVDLFIAAGLPATLEPNMPLWLRCHVPMCVAFQSVSVAGIRRNGGASWPESMTLARGIHESFELIAGLGHSIYPSGKARLRKSPAWIIAGMLWCLSRVSSFRTLLATGKAECESLVDAMVAAAPRANPPVDVAKIRAMKPSSSTRGETAK
jgi:2-dehydropantoate 2-reductase